MTVVAFLVASAAVAALGWRALRGVFAAPVLQRENYRGHALPVGTGIVVVIAVIVVSGVMFLVAVASDRPGPGVIASGAAACLVSVGLGLLGFLDDVLGTTTSRGFGGHLSALRRGEVTTGFLKLAGTPLVALAAVAVVEPLAWHGVRDAAVIAAAANLGNLFDRAPGRTIKVTVIASACIAPWGTFAALAGPLTIVGAGIGMLPSDLAEDGMLGDTGSNVLGAGVGLAVVVTFGALGGWIALAVLVALNLASEFVSFSKVIVATPPLRAVDRLGRRPV